MDSCNKSVETMTECLNNNLNKSFFNNYSNMVITLLCVGIITLLFFTSFNFKNLNFSPKDLALLLLLFAFLFYVNGYDKMFILSSCLFIVFYFVPQEKLESLYSQYLQNHIEKISKPRGGKKSKEKESFNNKNANSQNNNLDEDSNSSTEDDDENGENYEVTIDDPLTNNTMQDDAENEEEMHNENVLMDIQKKENKNDINVDVLLSQLQNDYLNK
jgi:hypothetical protein